MAKADALERAIADEAGGGEGGGSGAGGPSKASVVVPDQYICSITSEIMTDPITTVRLALCCRCALRPLSLKLSGLHSSPPLTVAKQADGFTYERSAIEQWLENHNTSPRPRRASSSRASSSSRTTRSAASSKTSTSRARSGTNVIALRVVASLAGGSVVWLWILNMSRT